MAVNTVSESVRLPCLSSLRSTLYCGSSWRWTGPTGLAPTVVSVADNDTLPLSVTVLVSIFSAGCY